MASPEEFRRHSFMKGAALFGQLLPIFLIPFPELTQNKIINHLRPLFFRVQHKFLSFRHAVVDSVLEFGSEPRCSVYLVLERIIRDRQLHRFPIGKRHFHIVEFSRFEFFYMHMGNPAALGSCRRKCRE